MPVTRSNSIDSSRPQVWLFVDSASDFGGHEAMLIRWLREIQLQGYLDCSLLARGGSRLEQQARCLLSTDTFRPERNSRWRLVKRVVQLWTMLRDAVKFGRTVFALRPSLCIIAEGFVGGTPMYALLARILRAPVVVYTPLVEGCVAMGFRSGWLRDGFTRWFYANLPHAWITITTEQADCFARWAHVQRPIFTLCNTVAAAIEPQADAKQFSAALSNESGCLNILVLGRLDSNQKGLDLLLDFLEGAATLRGILHVNIVGDGYYGETLEKRIRASNLLTTLVSSNPWLNSPVEIMSRHDVLFIPSRYEGVPLVMLEAMCLGLPVVSADLPGTRAFLPKACLFPVGDLGRAFEIMRELTRPEFRREVIGRNLEMFSASSSQTAFMANVSRLTDQLLGICARHRSIVTHLTDSPVAPNDLQISDGRVNARDAMH